MVNSLFTVLEIMSQKIDLPVDLIKNLLLMFLSIPLCAILRFIDKPLFRSVYSLSLGLFYLILQLQYWSLYVISVALIPFVLFKIVKGNYLIIAYALSAFFVLFIHIYRFMYDYMSWKIDCSVPVMFLTTKVIYFANYITHNKNKISLFDYLTYCFFFPTVLIGPTYNFSIFHNFMKKQFGYQNPQIKSKLLLKQVIKTIIFTVATAIVMPKFHPHWCLENSWFLSLSPFTKFLMINVIGICYRVKFYTAWGFTQIAIDLSGFSWNQKQENYSTVRCGSPRFQTEVNPRNKTNYWNSSVQLWLKQMIFDKVLSKTKSSNLATLVTFVVSAFWHGIYLTYYIGFIQWAFIITISKWAYKMGLAYPKLANNLYMKILAYIVSSCMLNYVGMLIVILTFKQGMQFYKSLNYIGHLMIGVFLVASFVIKPKSSRHRSQSNQKHQDRNHTQQSKTQIEAKTKKQRLE